jgi:hypothetical protein
MFLAGIQRLSFDQIVLDACLRRQDADFVETSSCYTASGQTE